MAVGSAVARAVAGMVAEDWAVELGVGLRAAPAAEAKAAGSGAAG